MKRKYDIDLFYELYLASLENLENQTDFPKVFYHAFNTGKNTITGKKVTSYKKYDDKWIDIVKSYIPSIDKITRNLKSNLKYQEDLTIIEKAKKTDKRSVMHLASNSHLIKEVRPQIIPKKVLVSQSEIEYGIYENRMVMTLILRLSKFLEVRIKEINDNLLASISNDTKLTTSFSLDDEVYDINFEMNNTSKKAFEDDLNKEVLKRVEELYRQINLLKSSQFMVLMKNQKIVTPPIMKTQIIMKNQDYKNAYHLWLYLDQYNEIEYELKTDVKQKRYDLVYKKHITQNLMTNLITILVHEHKQEKIEKLEIDKFKKYKNTLKSENDLDITLDNSKKKVEDDFINEFYLEEMKKVFLSEYSETEKKPNKSLQDVVKTMIEIQNKVYEKALGIDSDKDVFLDLYKSSNSKKEYQQAILKYDNLKAIRKEKELDLQQTIALEKTWQDVIYKTAQNMNDEVYQAQLLENKKAIDKIKHQTKTTLKSLDIKHKENLKKIKETNKLKLAKQKEKDKIKKLELLKKEKEKIAKKRLELKEKEQNFKK